MFLPSILTALQSISIHINIRAFATFLSLLTGIPLLTVSCTDKRIAPYSPPPGTHAEKLAKSWRSKLEQMGIKENQYYPERYYRTPHAYPLYLPPVYPEYNPGVDNPYHPRGAYRAPYPDYPYYDPYQDNPVLPQPQQYKKNKTPPLDHDYDYYYFPKKQEEESYNYPLFFDE